MASPRGATAPKNEPTSLLLQISKSFVKVVLAPESLIYPYIYPFKLMFNFVEDDFTHSSPINKYHRRIENARTVDYLDFT